MSYAISQFMCFTSLPTSNNLNPRARSSANAQRVVVNAEPTARVSAKPTFSGYAGALVLFCFRPALIVGINQLPEMIERGGADMPIAWVTPQASCAVHRSAVGLGQDRRRKTHCRECRAWNRSLPSLASSWHD